MKKHKKNRSMPPPSPSDGPIGLNVHTRDGAVCITLEDAGEVVVRLPLTPTEARILASCLLLTARELDTKGHVALMGSMAQDIIQRMQLAMFKPDGNATH